MPTYPLPSRPWVRGDVPFAWRDDRTLQVGDGARRVVIDGAPRALVTWLLTLQGDRTLAHALDDAERSGLRRQSAVSLLRRVLPTGMVDDSDEVPEGLRSAHPDLRQRLSGDIAAARLAHGLPADARRAIDRRLLATVAIHGDNPLADSVAASLTAAGVLTVVRESRPRSSSRRSRRLSTTRACHVMCDITHPDAATNAEAMALDVPHLPVVAFGSRAVIGPFVLPGLTGCLRCLDLHRTDVDPAWPRIAVQLQHQRITHPPLDSALVMAAAGWATLQVLAWLEADDAGADTLRWPPTWPAAAPPAIGARLTICAPGGSMTREECLPHPLCGCQWPMSRR